jgi:hypothetical protein
MGSARLAGASGLILAALVFFALAIGTFSRSEKYARLSTTQQTSTANVSQDYSSTIDSSGHSHGHVHCYYQFKVDEKLYLGTGCPYMNLTQTLRSEVLGGMGNRQFKATVYYDPADPSTNSLYAFSAAANKQMGVWFVCLGFVSLALVLLGALLAGTQNSLDPAVAAVAEGPTALPADYVPSDQRFLEDLDKQLRSEEPPDHTASS